MTFFQNFLHVFLPLFVAIDAIGIVPIFLTLTQGASPKLKKQLTTQSCITAFAISVVFLVAGKALFRFLGITENDFRIGGGIVLLILAIIDLLFSQQQEEGRKPHASLGVVPLGIPLIMGPGALTAVLIIAETQGTWLTLGSLVVNMGIVWLVFRQSKWVVAILGEGGSKAFAKVASLFLAAIAIMMIRVGVTQTILAFQASH